MYKRKIKETGSRSVLVNIPREICDYMLIKNGDIMEIDLGVIYERETILIRRCEE